MRVILTGGGTAGHINPAIAMADLIRRNEPDSEILFVGTPRGLEARSVPEAGYRLETISVRGLRRSLSPKNVKAAFLLLQSLRKSKQIIKDFNPDLVIGTGGYVCYPPLRQAARAGIPTVVHESNSVPGLAVRQLQGRVDRILLNYESTKESLTAKEKAVRVGNPVRGSFGLLDRAEARKQLNIPQDAFFVLSFGGSLGADRVNTAILELMAGFGSKHSDVLQIHATGRSRFDQVKAQFDAAELREEQGVRVVPYLPEAEMPAYMAACDVILCRAGALTLTEIALSGCCAILIPSPNVTGNHQYKNAKVLADGDGAILLEEETLAEGAVVKLVEELYGDPTRRETLRQNIRKFADPAAGAAVWQELTALLNEKGRRSQNTTR